MPLTGEAKKNYQREYMRRRRAGLTEGSNKSIRGSNSAIPVGSNKPRPIGHGLPFGKEKQARGEM